MEHLTSARTIARGAVGPRGWHTLEPAPGEPHQQPLDGVRHLASVWHLSDLHICDSESTARLEYLDRYSDPDSPYRDELGDIGTYRPQEVFTVHVAVTMVETVNSVDHGPVLEQPIDAVVLTGDLTDNAQRNELSWYQLIVEGGTICPRSGDPQHSSWVGATNGGTWDDRYWHPDGPPQGRLPDRPTRVYGYPTLPGLADAARQDVTSPGLQLPWVSVHGNHDALLQGTVAPTARLRHLATGGARIVGLPEGATPSITAAAIAEIGPARYIDDESSPRIPMASDAGRDFVHIGEFAATTRNGETTYFAQDVGQLRLVCLDTVNPHGGWQGSIDRVQLAWLGDELRQARDDKRRVVIASHHPSFTLTNDYAPEGNDSRVLAEELLATLLGAGVVIAWVAGHVHFHSANRLGDDQCGFWEITTSSLIDWPQQARILEFALDDGAAEVCIVSTVVDHHSPAGFATEGPFDRIEMASVSRALAANDYRLREGTLRGLLLDSSVDQRNAVWRSPDPLRTT